MDLEVELDSKVAFEVTHPPKTHQYLSFHNHSKVQLIILKKWKQF